MAITEHLLRNEDNNVLQKRILRAALSANMRGLAKALLIDGQRTHAKAYYGKAFMIHRSIKSLGKYLLSFLPTRLNVYLSKGKRIGPGNRRLMRFTKENVSSSNDDE